MTGILIHTSSYANRYLTILSSLADNSTVRGSLNRGDESLLWIMHPDLLMKVMRENKDLPMWIRKPEGIEFDSNKDLHAAIKSEFPDASIDGSKMVDFTMVYKTRRAYTVLLDAMNQFVSAVAKYNCIWLEKDDESLFDFDTMVALSCPDLSLNAIFNLVGDCKEYRELSDLMWELKQEARSIAPRPTWKTIEALAGTADILLIEGEDYRIKEYERLLGEHSDVVELAAALRNKITKLSVANDKMISVWDHKESPLELVESLMSCLSKINDKT